MIKKIKAVAYLADGGDGSQSFHVYPNMEILREEEGYNDPDDRTEEDFQAALKGYSFYDDGKIEEIIIEVEEVDGELRLAGTGFWVTTD